MTELDELLRDLERAERWRQRGRAAGWIAGKAFVAAACFGLGTVCLLSALRMPPEAARSTLAVLLLVIWSWAGIVALTVRKK